MFGRNHFINAPNRSLVGEDLSSRKVSRYLTENYLDENNVCQTRIVVKEIDLSVPQTPQSGIECVALDLSFAMSHNMPLAEGSQRLSLLGGGNPLADFRVLSGIMNESKSFEVEQEKNDK